MAINLDREVRFAGEVPYPAGPMELLGEKIAQQLLGLELGPAEPQAVPQRVLRITKYTPRVFRGRPTVIALEYARHSPENALVIRKAKAASMEAFQILSTFFSNSQHRLRLFSNPDHLRQSGIGVLTRYCETLTMVGSDLSGVLTSVERMTPTALGSLWIGSQDLKYNMPTIVQMRYYQPDEISLFGFSVEMRPLQSLISLRAEDRKPIIKETKKSTTDDEIIDCFAAFLEPFKLPNETLR